MANKTAGRKRMTGHHGYNGVHSYAPKTVSRAWVALGLISSAFGFALPAAAQETILITPDVPNDYDKGRNVSVIERGRPDYDALGISVNSFKLLPRVQVGLGYSDNVFLADGNRQDDAFLSVSPSIRANSNWSRHSLQLAAGAGLRRYLSETARDETNYNLAAVGRYDIGSEYALTYEGQLARQFESPLTGEVDSNLAAISSYRRGFVSVRGERRAGRTRVLGTVDRTTFNFGDIKQANGTVIDQSDRNRAVTRVRAQAEYGFTPSLAVYGQVTYEKTDYSRFLASGAANRDSRAIRTIAGFNFDLAGVMRGTFGAGYVNRRFRSPLYKDVSGVSVEAKIEYFPSQLTTVTFGVRRLISDSSIGTTSAYFDNRASVRVDHELRRNIILNASADFAIQDYIGTKQTSDVMRLGGGGRYLINRRYSIELTGAYSSRKRSGINTGSSFKEATALMSFVMQL